MSAPRAGSFDVRGFQAQLKARALGRAFEWHPFLGSTNDRARDWAREGAPHGALVLADEQWAGRGRHGRAWRSAAGEGVWSSLVVRTSRPAADLPQIPLVVGLGVWEALSLELAVPEVTLRWPNDIDLRGRKVAGILCEREATGPPHESAVIVGTGINVGTGAIPPELAGIATSLASEGFDLGREAVLAAYLHRVESRLDEWERDGFARLREGWLSRSGLVGRELRVRCGEEDVRGAVADLDREGALVLRTASGARLFHAGQVERVT